MSHFGERVYELSSAAMDTLTEASLSTPPRWRSLVRFPLVARRGSPSPPSSRSCGYDSDVIASQVQLCACGDCFVLATRVPETAGTPSHWTVCVGRRWMRRGMSEQRPDFRVWRYRWPGLETLSTPNTGRKRRWFWQLPERTTTAYWSYEFALNTNGRFLYGLAFSPGNKFRLDWLSVAETESASGSDELQAPRIESVWLELPPGVFASARANLPDPDDRIVLWSIDSATKRALVSAANTLPNDTLFGHDEETPNDEMNVDPNDDVLHIYTAKGWHFFWILDHRTGAPRQLEGVAKSLGVTVCHGWRQYNADAREMQTWILCHHEFGLSEPEWVLFSMPQQRQIASWCSKETFGGHEIDLGVISSDGTLLLCASREIRRVAIYDLKHMNREPVQWTCAERVIRAVPWTQHGILLALADDNQDQPSGRLEGWLWRPRTHISPNDPERMFSLDWSVLLPTDTERSAADSQDGDEAMESGSSPMTSRPGAEPRWSEASAQGRTTSVSGTASMALLSRWKWLQWRPSRESGDANEKPSSEPGCIRLEHLVTIDRDHALALVHDQQHGHLVYLEQPSWVSALAEALAEHDWEHARALLASMAIPEPMLALLRWRCSLRDADAARELIAALPEAWRWVAAYEAFQNQAAAAASAERVLLRAGCSSSSPMPAEVATRLGVRPETFLERERLVNALAAPTTATAETLTDTIRRRTMLLYQRCGLEAALNYLGACGALDAILAFRKQEAVGTRSLASVLQTIPLTADPHRYANLIEQYVYSDADPTSFETWCLERADQVDTCTGSLRHVQRLLALAVSLLDANQNNRNTLSGLRTRETLSKHLQATVRMREALQWQVWQRELETLSWRRFVSLTPVQLLGRLLTATLWARRTTRPSTHVPALPEVLGSDLIMHLLEGCRADEAHGHLEAALNEVLCCRSTELDMMPESNLEEMWLEAMVEALQVTTSCALCEVLEWHEEPFSGWCWSRLARTTLQSLPLTHQETRRLGAALSAHHETDLMLETLALSETLTKDIGDQAYRRQLRQWLWQARVGRLSGASNSEQSPYFRKRIRQCFVEHAQEGSQSVLARFETLLELHGLQMSPIERISCLVASYRGEGSVASLVIESIQRMVDSVEAASLLWRVALYCFEEESYPPECAEQLLQYGANLWRRGSVSQQIRARALVQIVRMLVACRELGLPAITPRRLAWQLGPAVWIWHFHRLLETYSDGSADDAVIQVASLAQLETAVEWLLARCARADPLALAYYPPTALERLGAEDRCVAMPATTDEAKRVAFASGSCPSRSWIALARRLLREAGPWQSQVQRVLYNCLTECGSLPIDLTWIQRYYGSEPCPATSVQVPCSSSPVAIAQEAQRHRLAIPAILYRTPLDRLDPEIWLDTCIAIWVLRQPPRVAAGRATLLPPAGDIRQVTCTSLAQESAGSPSQAGASAVAMKFRAAARQICEAYHWVMALDTTAATADMDCIEKRVRRFLRDQSYREEVVAASLAHTVAPDRLEELAQPVIESAARIQVSSARCRLAHIRWCLEWATPFIPGRETVTTNVRMSASSMTTASPAASLQRERTIVELLVQHDGLGEELVSIAHGYMDRAETRTPHPVLYVILALTEQDPRAACLADAAQSDDSLDPAFLWLLYTAKENSSLSLNAYVRSQPALAPKTGLCLWRVAVSCGMDSAALLDALVQKVLESNGVIAFSAIRDWFLESMQHPDAAVRCGFAGVWAEALLARGGRTESERGYILEWIEDLLSEMDEGDAARAESRHLLVFVRRVLEYSQALWNDRELAAAGVAATLSTTFATSCPAELARHSERSESLHATRRPMSDSMIDGERLADQYVAQQTLDWLANQTPSGRQQWRVHLEAIFALANAPVSLALPEPQQRGSEHADRTPEPETNVVATPAPEIDETSDPITDSIVKSVLDGDIWQVGWQCLQRQGWSLHACTPENALALVQRHLEASVSATNRDGHVSDASRSATMRALALLCEWRAALDMMGD